MSRGRECVFINDPRISRSKKAAAARRASQSAASSASTSDAGSDYFPSPSPTAEVPPNTPLHECPGADHEHDTLGLDFGLHLSHPQYAGSYSRSGMVSDSYFPSTSSLPMLSSSPTTTASSPSPTLDPFENQYVDFAQPYPGVGVGPSVSSVNHQTTLHEHLNKIFPSDMFTSPFDGGYPTLGGLGAGAGADFMLQEQLEIPEDPFSFFADAMDPNIAMQQQQQAQYVDQAALYQQLAQAPAPVPGTFHSPHRMTEQVAYSALFL
jgi:hypothetical protein